MPDDTTNGPTDGTDDAAPEHGIQEVAPQYGITAGGTGPDDPDAVAEDADAELHDLGDVPDDDLLFDPLLSDEPIDLAAVRADDALIDALSDGTADVRELVDPDDPLIAMLAAWAASAQPASNELPADADTPALEAADTGDTPAESLVTVDDVMDVLTPEQIAAAAEAFRYFVVRVPVTEEEDPKPLPTIISHDVPRQVHIIRRLIGHNARKWTIILLSRVLKRLRRRR